LFIIKITNVRRISYDKEYIDPQRPNMAFLNLDLGLEYENLEHHGEFFIYDWVAFLSEIGGYSGLLLGK
jgi:hypothetical protein